MTSVNERIEDFPRDTCPFCDVEEEAAPIALVGYEFLEGQLMVQVGYECSAGHRWFTRWPPEATSEISTVVRCMECDGLLRSPKGGSGHRPLCSRS